MKTKNLTKTKKTTTTKNTKKPQAVDAPMTRNEFKVAISKMTRDELIGLLCDIYYSQTSEDDGDEKGGKGGCECGCGCGSESKSKKTATKISKISKVSTKN